MAGESIVSTGPSLIRPMTQGLMLQIRGRRNNLSQKLIGRPSGAQTFRQLKMLPELGRSRTRRSSRR